MTFFNRPRSWTWQVREVTIPPTPRRRSVSRRVPMAEPATFQDLIRRIRAGDPEAAAELVRRYEPTIRRAVRVRLVDARLGALLDSLDVCQSVLASFFVRSA